MDSKSVPDTSILKSRLCSAVHFLLECFGSMHYLDSARCISFALKDIRTYLNQMDSTLLKEAFAEVPFTTLSEFGFLKQETSDGLHIAGDEELLINNELGYLKNETSVEIDLIEDGALEKCGELENIAEEKSAKLDSFEGSQLRSDVHTGDLRRLFFVCYLSINGKTHLKKIFKDFCDLVPREVSKGLSFAPEIGKLSYFKKHEEYFRIDSSWHLELQEAFYSSTRDSRNGSYFQAKAIGSCIDAESETKCSFGNTLFDKSRSYKPMQNKDLEQGYNANDSEVSSYSLFDKVNLHEKESNSCLPCDSLDQIVCLDRSCIVRNEQCLSNTNNIVAPDKELVSRRIRSSVMYLNTFFVLGPKRKRKIMGVILQVLEDVDRFFSISSILDKVDMIQKSFVPLFSKDTFTIDSSCSPSCKVVPYIDEHERKMLYFYCFLTIHGSMKYSSLFYAFHGTNGGAKKDSPTVQMSDFEQLTYFMSLRRLFTVDNNGTVKPCPLPDLYLHESIKSYVFKPRSNDSEFSNDKKSAKNLSLQSQDIWCKDNLVYKRLCFFISYLLHSFGQQTCDRLMNCISYVFPDIGMFLSELTMEKQQEIFTSIPFTVLKSNNSMILIDAWELDNTYASTCECFQLHLVANVALCDKKCAYELIQDFLRSLPNKFKLYNNGRWLRKLKSSKFLDCDNESNVALPNLFYSRTGDTNSVPQAIVPEFSVSEKLLKSLGFPLNILETLTERMVDGIACLLDYFQPNLYSGFVEVVLKVLKKGSAFFKLPQSYQEAVIKNCFDAFIVDERGYVTYSQALRKQKYRTTTSRQCLLCMAYIVSEKGSIQYQEAFESYQKCTRRTKPLSKEKQLSYFKNRKNVFLVDDNGVVSLWKIKSIEFDYLSIIMPEGNSEINIAAYKKRDSSSSSSVNVTEFSILKSSNSSTSKNVCSENNNLSDGDHTASSIKSLDSNDSNYTTFEESASFLLSVFGPLSSKILMECISHIFSKNAKLLNGWSEEEWHKMFLNFPSVVLKDGNLQLIEPFEFIRRSVSLTKVISLFTTCYLILKGTTHYTIVLQKLYQLAPEVAFPDFENASNPKWHGYFRSKSKLFTMTSRGYLTLPLLSFKTAIAVEGASSQSELLLRNEDNVFSAIRNATTDKELDIFSSENQVFDNSSMQFHGLKIAQDYPVFMTDEDLITFSTDDQEPDSTSKQVEELKLTLDRSHDGLNSTTNCPELKSETFGKSFTQRDNSPVNTKCCHVMSDENIKKQPCQLTESNSTNGAAFIFSKSIRSPVNQKIEFPPGTRGADSKWFKPPITPGFSDITDSSSTRDISFTNVPISTTVEVPLGTNKNGSDCVPSQRSDYQVTKSTTTDVSLDSSKNKSNFVLIQRRSIDQIPMSTTTDVSLDAYKSESDCVSVERRVDQVPMLATTDVPLNANKNELDCVLIQRSVDQVPMLTTTDVSLDTNKSKSDCVSIERRVDQVPMLAATDVPLNVDKSELDCVHIQRSVDQVPMLTTTDVSLDTNKSKSDCVSIERRVDQVPMLATTDVPLNVDKNELDCVHIQRIVDQVSMLTTTDVSLDTNKNKSDCVPIESNTTLVHQQKTNRRPIKSRSRIISRILGYQDNECYPESAN